MSGAGPAHVMRQEHGQIKELLEVLHDKVRVQDPESDAEEEALLAALATHNVKEEQILFPLVKKLETEDAHAAQSHCGSIQNPIRVMFMEHDHAGDAIEQMSALTEEFVPLAHASNTYRAMLDGLSTLRRDLHQHVHKKNNILFRRRWSLRGSWSSSFKHRAGCVIGWAAG